MWAEFEAAVFAAMLVFATIGYLLGLIVAWRCDCKKQDVTFTPDDEGWQ